MCESIGTCAKESSYIAIHLGGVAKKDLIPTISSTEKEIGVERSVHAREIVAAV